LHCIILLINLKKDKQMSTSPPWKNLCGRPCAPRKSDFATTVFKTTKGTSLSGRVEQIRKRRALVKCKLVQQDTIRKGQWPKWKKTKNTKNKLSPSLRCLNVCFELQQCHQCRLCFDIKPLFSSFVRHPNAK